MYLVSLTCCSRAYFSRSIPRHLRVFYMPTSTCCLYVTIVYYYYYYYYYYYGNKFIVHLLMKFKCQNVLINDKNVSHKDC